MAKVVLKDVSKIYEGGVKAVNNFNLEIHDKEFIVFVGPSGCGKSTTLRMIAGLEEITSGELYIGDRLVNDVPAKDRDIAMVFQNYALYPHMSVYENMAFGLKLRKYPKDEIDSRVREAANIIEIGNLLDRKPKALSGGQRQRVAVGRAIVRKPKVFLFDEPLSNLDAKLRGQMRAELSKIHVRLQATMIYVTHDQIEAMTMGDRIVVMRDGLIQQVGSPLDVYGTPQNKFVAGFVGSPPMNFIDVEISESSGNVMISDGAFKVKVPSGYAKALRNYMQEKGTTVVTFGIRPEDMHSKDAYSGEIDENVIRTNVEVVETLGAETHIFVNTGKSPAICRFDASNANIKVNEEVQVVMNLEKAHFFDKETEARINPIA